jgi:hypothetical protein
MARVDAEDDTLRRYIVRHYRYDPERHERRHVVVRHSTARRSTNAVSGPYRQRSSGAKRLASTSTPASMRPEPCMSPATANGQPTDGLSCERFATASRPDHGLMRWRCLRISRSSACRPGRFINHKTGWPGSSATGWQAAATGSTLQTGPGPGTAERTTSRDRRVAGRLIGLVPVAGQGKSGWHVPRRRPRRVLRPAHGRPGRRGPAPARARADHRRPRPAAALPEPGGRARGADAVRAHRRAGCGAAAPPGRVPGQPRPALATLR